MIIYISHPTILDYKNDLYAPLRASELNKIHELILPHEESSGQYNTKELFSKGLCDLVIAECSAASTGQGIELGWADFFTIPIIGFYKKDIKPSGAMYAVTDHLVEYESSDDLIQKISEFLVKFSQVT